MALFQGLAVGPLSGRVSELIQLAFGFILMGLGIALLLLVRTQTLIFGAVGLQALGMAFISPNLSTLTSKRSGSQTGTALGLQYSANNLGQVAGPLLGGALFAWQAASPYLLTSLSLLVIGVVIGFHRRSRLSPVSLAA